MIRRAAQKQTRDDGQEVTRVGGVELTDISGSEVSPYTLLGFRGSRGRCVASREAVEVAWTSASVAAETIKEFCGGRSCTFWPIQAQASCKAHCGAAARSEYCR